MIMYWIMGAFAIGLFLFAIYNFFREIWSCFDHCKWEKEAEPDVNAYIAQHTRQMVQYAKNNAKYKTVLTFSDGFSFTTFKTGRKNRFTSYQIYIDQELKESIITKAVDKHDRAAIKKLGGDVGRTESATRKGPLSGHNDFYVKPEELAPMPEVRTGPAVREQKVPHYGQLEAPTKVRGVVAWSYHFSHYDVHFAKACGQALIDQAEDVISVRTIAGNGVQKEMISELQETGQKITEHEAFRGSLKGLQVTVSKKKEIVAIFSPGSDVIRIEADPSLSQDEVALWIDMAVHQVMAND